MIKVSALDKSWRCIQNCPCASSEAYPHMPAHPRYQQYDRALHIFESCTCMLCWAQLILRHKTRQQQGAVCRPANTHTLCSDQSGIKVWGALVTSSRTLSTSSSSSQRVLLLAVLLADLASHHRHANSYQQNCHGDCLSFKSTVQLGALKCKFHPTLLRREAPCMSGLRPSM